MTSTSGTDQPEKIGYASINGLEMYYEIHGQGQPLVLLHGALVIVSHHLHP